MIKDNQILLTFESKEDVDQFLSWWMNGGGEQGGPYTTATEKSDWQGPEKTLTLEKYEDDMWWDK